jgi:hypothetical protein
MAAPVKGRDCGGAGGHRLGQRAEQIEEWYGQLTLTLGLPAGSRKALLRVGMQQPPALAVL